MATGWKQAGNLRDKTLHAISGQPFPLSRLFNYAPGLRMNGMKAVASASIFVLAAVICTFRSTDNSQPLPCEVHDVTMTTLILHATLLHLLQQTRSSLPPTPHPHLLKL